MIVGVIILLFSIAGVAYGTIKEINGKENGISTTLQMLGVVVGIFAILGMLIVNTNIKEAKVKQRLINEAFNTEYTLDEVYRAKDVIFLIEGNTDLDN